MARVPCVLMRGGTSRGPFFLASDLPTDPAARDAFLLTVMGSPHPLQVDGLGGANPLTSKVAIVSPSQRPDADVGIRGFVAGNFGREKLPLVGPRLMPDRHHAPRVMRAAARRGSRE